MKNTTDSILPIGDLPYPGKKIVHGVPLRVLVACEHTGAVRDAFRARGHHAVSCDLIDDESEHGGAHILGDCKTAIEEHGPWDLIIAHPPCTALTVAGNRHYGVGKPKHEERLAAIEWTMDLWALMKANATACVMENPQGVLPLKATQYVHPWEHGHGVTKRTGLWVHNLPTLVPTDVVPGRDPYLWNLPPSEDRWKQRSATFKGIARAMADQWSHDAR
jgi:site-specific DNA-cytosine methylase